MLLCDAFKHWFEDALKSYEVSFTLLPMMQRAKEKAVSASNQMEQKAKGKNKSKFEPRIPQQIREDGGTASTPDGDPICFDYSLKRRKEQVTDGRCRKGFMFAVCAMAPIA